MNAQNSDPDPIGYDDLDRAQEELRDPLLEEQEGETVEDLGASIEEPGENLDDYDLDKDIAEDDDLEVDDEDDTLDTPR